MEFELGAAAVALRLLSQFAKVKAVLGKTANISISPTGIKTLCDGRFKIDLHVGLDRNFGSHLQVAGGLIGVRGMTVVIGVLGPWQQDSWDIP